MILDRKLKSLHVAVKAGGSIVSHRPVFSKDSKSLFVISNNTVHIYSTKTGLIIGQLQSPNLEVIANIALVPPPIHERDYDEEAEILIILTSTGLLAQIDCSNNYELLCTENINLSMPGSWSRISEWLNIQCLQLNQYLMLARIDSADEEIMLYHVHRNLPKSYKNKSKKLSHFELDKICWNIQRSSHSTCFGADTKLIGAIQDDSLFIMDYPNKVSKWHKSGTRTFTCVAAHPTKWVIATGDDSGRIVLWNNLFEKSPIKTIFHWHTLPVSDLCLTAGGTQMLSGGGECTLVKWDVTNPVNKRTLPRMGLPIRHITVSPENTFFAVSHADNSIQLVNCINEIETLIQNLTQCYIPENPTLSDSASKYFRAGLHSDPRTNNLIMNGKPGHLQCYSFREDKHLYNLDITQQNFITSERNKIIQNTDITQVSFSNHGKWLATGESLINPANTDTCLELRLKFWEFDKTKQMFVLNTSIDWPHEVGLKGLRIQGIDDEDFSLMAATTGEDKLFKTWGIVNDGSSLHGKSYWWNCENVGSYRDLPAGPLAFSRDGSVLAVAFGHTLTLWICDNHELRGSLCHTKLQEELKMVEFGCHMSSHLVICCSSKNIIVWDVITLTLTWTVPFEAESLAVDPLTNTAAVFSTKKHVFFFRPETPQPLAIHKNISRSTVVSSLFVPNSASYQLNTLKSTLIFMNSSQELCVFLSKDSGTKLTTPVKARTAGNAPTLTPFAQLIPERTITEIDKSNKRNPGGQPSVGLSGSRVIREIIDASPHTMPSVTFFCDQLLSAVSTPRKLSNDILEIEKHVARSHRKKKQSLLTSEDTDDESDGEGNHDLSFSSRGVEVETTNKDPEPLVNTNQTVNLDLHSVSADNIAWIQSIFSSSTDLVDLTN